MFDVEIPIDWTLVVVGLVLGVAVLATAASLGMGRGSGARHPAPTTWWTPIVPWLGAALALALAVRGSLVAAAVVAIAALGHAVVTRRRARRG